MWPKTHQSMTLGYLHHFKHLQNVLHESKLDKRTQYMIEIVFQVSRYGFKDNPTIPEELDVA